MAIVKKTKEELRQLAVDIADGKVYTNRHLPNPEMVNSVFLLIGLGGLHQHHKDDIDSIGLIYEYLSEAGPRSINGQPQFFSLRLLDKEDTELMFQYYNKYLKTKQEFLSE